MTNQTAPPGAAPPGSAEAADQAAPLDALLTDAALGTFHRFAPDASAAKFAAALARRPHITGRRLGSFAAELVRIGAGTSALAPARGDRRFADPAWTGNALLRRIVQSYLAAGQTADQLVRDAGLYPRDDKRVRFGAGNLLEAMSPSNLPLVNPASAKAVIDTGGLSLVRGGLTLLHDVASPPRIPEMVDRSAFEVGRNIAVTPGEVVLRTEVLELIQYRPQTEQVREVPLLIVPPTINKFYALDLAPGRSMVEYLAQNGQQVFMISWRNPDVRHAGWGLDTYVKAVLDALDGVERICGAGRTAVMGVCAGGIIASVMAAHLAAAGQQDRLACFGLLVTVLDTANAGTVAALADQPLVDAAKAMSARRGYLDGRALAGAADLTDVIGEHAADPAAQALALDRLVGAHVAPFYQDQAVIDAARLAMMRHTIFGAPPPPPSRTPGRVTYSQLRVAASWDPAAFRAFWKINGMVCPPDEVYTDPDVVACTQETLRRHGTGPPVAQPTAEQLLTALTR